MKLRSEGKAPASPPDRSQRRSSATQERDMSVHRTSSRHTSTGGKTTSYTTQYTQESQDATYHGDIQGASYASPGIDNSYFASASDSHPYSQAAHSASYDTTSYADYSHYSGLPEYYPESSLEPSQYSTTEQQFYASGDGLTSYGLDHRAAPDLNGQLAHSDVYVGKIPALNKGILNIANTYF